MILRSFSKNKRNGDEEKIKMEAIETHMNEFRTKKIEQIIKAKDVYHAK